MPPAPTPTIGGVEGLVWDEANRQWRWPNPNPSPTREPLSGVVYFHTFGTTFSDTVTNTTAVPERQTECECEACKLVRNDPTRKISRKTVEGYSFKPRWQRRKVGTEKPNYFLGVELETSSTPQSHYTDNEFAAAMARPENLWVAKRDSSVSGPEFSSHPASLAYWHKKAESIGEMFRMLIHYGYRSHDGAESGMHVNISQTAFESEFHLFDFLRLINGYSNWSLAMSQRNASQVQRWCPFSVGHGDERSQNRYLQSLSREFFYRTRSRSWGLTNKYSAVNIPLDGRVEFRLPRGTLRLDRFMKNLEWTDAMIKWASTGPVTVDPVAFMVWVENQADGIYDNLKAFISERETALIAVADDRSF